MTQEQQDEMEAYEYWLSESLYGQFQESLPEDERD